MFRNNADQRDLHWLKIRLIGDPSRGSNRDAIGARIVVTTDDHLHMTREVQGGSGYLSMNPKQQHFGLGRSQSADVQIVWPNGEQQKLENLAANHTYTVKQGEPTAPAAEDQSAATAASEPAAARASPRIHASDARSGDGRWRKAPS